MLAILVLATTLSGLAQGRGQPLPAQSGTLFPGPALTTALLPKANAPVELAPARSGANVDHGRRPPGTAHAARGHACASSARPAARRLCAQRCAGTAA